MSWAVGRRCLVVALVVLPARAGSVAEQVPSTPSLADRPGPAGGDALIGDLGQRALDLVARESGRDRSVLRIAHHSIARYRLQAVSGFSYKVLDVETGTLRRVVLDAAGSPLDVAALDAAETALRSSPAARVHPLLAQRMASARGNEPLPVIVWIDEGEETRPLRPALSDLRTKEDVRAFLDETDRRRAVRVARAVTPIRQYLAAQGHGTTPALYVPALGAELPSSAVWELARLPQVVGLYPSVAHAPELDVVRATVGADLVPLQYRGYGVKAAVVEAGHGRVLPDPPLAGNEYLAGTVQQKGQVCTDVDYHAVAVAGIIRSTHPTYLGVAPDVTLWTGGTCLFCQPNVCAATFCQPAAWCPQPKACNNLSLDLQARSTAAANWGASVLNLSWGFEIGTTPGADDRFYDDLVINRRRTVVKSAGNHGACHTVTSPGLGYNVVTVGAFDDANTPTTGDDAMWPNSDCGDPDSLHGDREKPELVAPGVGITTTLTYPPWVGELFVDGTSLAAPVVTGTVADMMSRHVGLTAFPEAVRAILLATARQTLAGWTCSGAGGVKTDFAVDLVGTMDWSVAGYNCGMPEDFEPATFSLTAGQFVRVAIAWSSDPADGNWPTTPSADLDLVVIPPSGSSFSMASEDNNYEWLEFYAPTTGSYTLRIHKTACTRSPRWVGYAWHVLP